MERKKSVLLVGIACLIVSIGAGFFLAYPLSGDSPETGFTSGDSSTYVSTGAVSIGDEFQLRYEATVLGEDGVYIRRGGDDGFRVSEIFHRENTTYAKFVTEPSDDEWLESRASAPRRDVVHTENETDRAVLVTEEDAAARSVTVDSDRAWIVSNLGLTAYEAVDESMAGESSVYTPVDTWVQDGENYRITDSGGSVTTDSDTGVVTAASVEFDVTVASSYAEYVTNDPTQMRVEYEYDPDPEIDEVDTPEWVERCVDAAECDL